MSDPLGGLDARQTSAADNKPHILRFQHARTAAGDPVVQVFNGDTAADLIFEIDKDGNITELGTVDGVDVAAFKAAYDAFVASFSESVDDRVAALLVQAGLVTVTYDDVANTLTIDAAASSLSVRMDDVLTGSRGNINFLTGVGIELDVADDVANDEVEVTLSRLFVGARAHRTASQSIPNATTTALLFTAESNDTSGIHDNATNPSRFTVPAGMDGKWLAGVITYPGGGTGRTQLWPRVDGSTNGRMAQVFHNAGGVSSVETSDLLTLTAGQYVEFVVSQNSGGPLDMYYDGGLYWGARAFFIFMGK